MCYTLSHEYQVHELINYHIRVIPPARSGVFFENVGIVSPKFDNIWHARPGVFHVIVVPPQIARLSHRSKIHLFRI